MRPTPDLTTVTIQLRDRLPSPDERRAIRDRLGISQALVARELGVSEQTVANWEKGTSTPRAANLAAYVHLLDRLRETATARGLS